MRGQEGRLLRLHGLRGSRALITSSASIPRPRTPRSPRRATARCSTSRCSASPRRGGRGTPPRCWRRSSGRRRRPAAGRRSSGSRSASGPAPSPACGSASPPRGRSALSRGLPLSGVCTLDALGRGPRRGGRRATSPRRPRRPPRRGLRGALRGGGRAALGALARDPGGAGHADPGAAAGGAVRRIGRGTISAAVDEPGRRDPGRRRPRAPRRRAAHLCPRGRHAGRGRVRFRRPDLPEAPRCGTVA